MKIYRVHFDKQGKSKGYQFTTNRPAAHAATMGLPKGTTGTIDILEVSITKQGILEALRRYASHANNG